MLDPSHHQALTRLLMQLFSASELRQFMRFEPAARDIYPHLPEREASLAELCFEVVDLLDRHGAIDEGLFGRLREARPGRLPEIDAVAEDLLDAAPETRPRASSGPTDDAAPDEPARRREPADPTDDAAPVHATDERASVAAPHRVVSRWPLALAGLLLLAAGAASVTLASRCGPTPDPAPPRTAAPAPVVALAEKPAAPPPASSTTPPPRDVTAPIPAAPAPATSASPAPHPTPARPRPRDHPRTLQTIRQLAKAELRACSDKIGAMDPQRVVVALHVDAQGKIGKVTASGTSYGDAFHTCIARAVQTVKLPPGPAEDLRYQWLLD